MPACPRRCATLELDTVHRPAPRRYESRSPLRSPRGEDASVTIANDDADRNPTPSASPGQGSHRYQLTAAVEPTSDVPVAYAFGRHLVGKIQRRRPRSRIQNLGTSKPEPDAVSREVAISGRIADVPVVRSLRTGCTGGTDDVSRSPFSPTRPGRKAATVIITNERHGREPYTLRTLRDWNRPEII